MDFNYDPRCGVYLNGHYYYISYYLPNKSRICRCLGTTKKVIAKKKMHLKEQELYQGVFDDHDISRMPKYQFASKVRLDLETAEKNTSRPVPSTKNLDVISSMSMH